MNIYAKSLERAINNFYKCENQISHQTIFNAIHDGLNNGMNVIIPIETPEEIISGDKSKDKIALNFRHLRITEDGQYFIPVFTSEAQLQKGEPTSAVEQPLKTLIDALGTWERCMGIAINPWGEHLAVTKPMLKILNAYTPKSQISIVRASVLDIEADAIVNSANERLEGGLGLTSAIHKAAGPKLLTECKELGGCRPGMAKKTAAYDIKTADYIFHTVGAKFVDDKDAGARLATSYINCMNLALANGCKSIAFPCISTGANGYALETSAKVAILTIGHWLSEHKDTVINVYLCCNTDEEYAAYKGITKK